MKPSRVEARRPLYGNSSRSSKLTTEASYRTGQDSEEENLDETEEDEGLGDNEKSLEDVHSSMRVSYSPESRMNFEMSRSVPRTPQRPRKTFPEGKNRIVKASKIVDQTSWSKFAGATLCSVLFVLIAYKAIGNLPANAKYFNCTYEQLKNKHPEQKEFVWQSLEVGIENILNKKTHSPGVYLLLHNGESKVRHLIKEIALESSKCFGDSMQLVEMTQDDFNIERNTKDYGTIIQRFRSKIKSGKVALVANLNEIPAVAAPALHSICDTVSPLVEDIVVFLTLEVPSNAGKPNSVAKDFLFDLWGTMPDNELGPLITRVTDHVISLRT